MLKGLMVAIGATLRSQSSRPRARTTAMSVRRVEPAPYSRFFRALTLQPARNAKVAPVDVLFQSQRLDLLPHVRFEFFNGVGCHL
jgi:hypothetical protein